MLRKLSLRVSLLASLIFALAAAPGWAQTGTGRISGLVKDSGGGFVPGVTVVALHEQTGVRHETVTTQTGQFVFPSLPVGPYSVSATLTGFKTVMRTKNLLTVGSDLNVSLQLEPGGVEETVTVTAEARLVQTNESSVSTLISEQTIVTLPLNGRNPLHLIGLVPGVVGHSAEATASGGTATHYINGDRGRGITTTQDGIDISDPVIPRGELTNAPVNPDAIQEFQVVTSNAKSEYGRSAGGQVEMVTKSGTNQIRGSVYEFFRNTSLDSNSYFNELRGLPTEVLERNQFGASIGGPIKKDKAFFFVNYEGQRRTQETSQLFTVPTAALRAGNFRFVTQPCPGQTAAQNRPSCVDASGNPVVPTSSYNYVANDPRGLGLDPVMQGETLKLLPLPNDFSIGDGLNTAGYRWNSPTEGPVDTVTARLDYTVSQKHSVFLRYNQAFRNDLINDIINTDPRPMSWPARVRISDQLGGALGIKSTLTPYIFNELTVGFTKNVLDFADPEHPRTYEVCRASCIFGSPLVYWPGTARKPIQYQILDNVSWVRGSHAFKTGINFRGYHIDQERGAGTPFGIYPSFTFTRTDAAFTGIDPLSVQRPDGSRANLTGSGINATDRNNLNTFYNVMLGRIGRIDQTFYSNGESFAPLQPLTLKQRVNEYNVFVQDDWRVNQRLTLNLGLRWELNSVPYDEAGVQVINDKPLDGSQGPVSFVPAGPGTGRQWFKTDWNNFAPNLGFAYDLSGDGKMAVRGGYRLAYQRVITWALNVVEQRQPATSLNQFLVAPRDPSLTGTDTVMRLNELLKGGRIPTPQGGTSLTLVNGVPQLSAPPAINRTPPNNRNEQPLFFDENMTTPYVHQWNVGFQRQFGSNTVIDVAYVGSRGVNLLRMTNVNQMDLNKNGFINDFKAAQLNLARNGNPNVGEPTGNLGRLYGGTIPTTAYSDITLGNVGVVANSLDRQTAGIGLSAAGLPDNFFRPNPQFGVAGLASSSSSSRYNSLQLQLKRRFAKGMTVAMNYTFAKSTDDLSNDTRGAGTEIIVQSDPKRPELDEARSDFDVRHVFRGYFIWDLPFGKDRRFGGSASKALDLLIGGWQVNGIVDASSGYPFSVFSGYHAFTYYDAGTRVATDSANGVTNRAAFTGSGNIGRVTETATGVEFFSTEERAQFQTPAVGETGSGRNLFTGPGFFQLDLAVFKNINLGASRRFELRMEVFNVLNTVNFSQPNFLATAGSFGTITGTRVPPRIIQFGAKFYF